MQSEKRSESFTEEVSPDNCTSVVELFSRGKRCVFSAWLRAVGMFARADSFDDDSSNDLAKMLLP